MLEDYGLNRVIGNDGMLPILAWKLDNRKIVYDNELMLNVKRIHVETASFKQICSSAGHDEERIKEKILDIVNDRGKLHNPFTDTGGTLYGEVEKIGVNYKNKRELVPGDEVIVEMSATMVPLRINKILSVDYVYGCIGVEGYCILFNYCPLIKKPANVPVEIVMLAFEESASIYHVYEIAKGKKEFLISGNNLLISTMYAHAIRKATGNEGRIVGLFFPQYTGYIPVRKLESLLQGTFDKMHHVDTTSIQDVIKIILDETPQLFDLCISCSDTVGAEVVGVLASKENGTLFLSSLINNYQIALFLTEGIGKELNILGAYAYAEGYDEFILEYLAEVCEPLTALSNILYELRSELVMGEAAKRKRQTLKNEHGFVTRDFVYKSKAMEFLLEEVARAAKYNCTIMLKGETGVGKEKIARLIHSMSARRTEPFISVNCASIPENLAESEFFGYEKGAFTGANTSGKTGFFEMANKGFLFLDEIGELSPAIQGKMLRVLQENEFYRIGGTAPVRIDIRIITATNRDLKEMASQGQFRKDLYYRLAVLPIIIPPLRDRKEDIIPIAEYFINKYNEKYSTSIEVEDEGLQCFLEYQWPGNIRELENMVQRILINSENNVVTAQMVLKEINKERLAFIAPKLSEPQRTVTVQFDGGTDSTYKSFIEEQEKEFIKYHLSLHKTTRKAAESLGMTQSQLMRKKKKYNL